MHQPLNIPNNLNNFWSYLHSPQDLEHRPIAASEHLSRGEYMQVHELPGCSSACLVNTLRQARARAEAQTETEIQPHAHAHAHAIRRAGAGAHPKGAAAGQRLQVGSWRTRAWI